MGNSRFHLIFLNYYIYIYIYIASGYKDGYWLHITDEQWIDTIPLESYTNWQDGQPGGKDHCVVSLLDDKHQWKVVKCGDKNLPLCQSMARKYNLA